MRGLQVLGHAGLCLSCHALQPRSEALVGTHEQLVPSPGTCNKLPGVLNARHWAMKRKPEALDAGGLLSAARMILLLERCFGQRSLACENAIAAFSEIFRQRCSKLVQGGILLQLLQACTVWHWHSFIHVYHSMHSDMHNVSSCVGAARITTRWLATARMAPRRGVRTPPGAELCASTTAC